MRHFDYTPSPKEGELVGVLRTASAVGETGMFIGGGYTAYRLFNFIPSLQSLKRVRAGLGFVSGLYLQRKMAQAVAIVSVQQIALLDTPMGHEMVALVQEGEFSPEAKQNILWVLKPGRREALEPRIRPISNPFSQAAVREAEMGGVQAQEAERNPAHRDSPDWAAQKRVWPQQSSNQSSNDEAEWQQEGAVGEGWSDRSSSHSGQDLAEELLEQDIFGAEDDQQPEENDSLTRKPRHRERREERRRRHNEAVHKPAADDAMSDYFDSRWEGKGN